MLTSKISTMKNKIILLSFSAAMLLGGCKKDYLEVTPTTSIASSDAFKSTANAWAALNGIHRSLYIQYYGQQDEGGQGANMTYMDMLGDDLVNPTTGNGWYISTYRWTAHRSATGTVPYFNYRFYYTIIANANMIIDNIEGANGPDADKKIIKGQALAYRAWSYYQMIQLFGKRYDASGANDTPGLPLILTSTVTAAVPRSTVAQVYTQINADLDNAITLLGTPYTRANKSHINLSVAQGFKARVALTQQNWAVAATMANAARQGYSLMTTAQYLQGFNNYTNPEWMWGSHQQDDQTTFFYSFFAFMSADYNSTNIRTNPKAINSLLYNQIPATDVRKGLWDPTGTNTSFPIPPGGVRKPYMSRKFLSAGGSNSSIGDVPMMRAAEMYLIEAEAKARLNDASAANVLFQLVSKRNASYVQSTSTGQALIDEILLQRRIELWGEGFRFYDLKRLNQPLNRTGANHDPAVAVTMQVPAGDKQWEFLIPQDEINFTNGVVTQNPL
jgi:hypothetical protein